MAKRFTDTNIWDDPWFRKLAPKYKEFWRYLYEKCDYAGIWKKDFEMASFLIGEEIKEEEVLRLFNTKEKQRIVILNDEKWFIPQFIHFQYGKLNPQNKIHLSIINILKKEGVYKSYLRVNKGLAKGYLTLKEKEKEKEKDKDKEKDKEKEEELYKEKYKDSKIYQFLTQNIYFKNIKYPARLTHRLIDTYKDEELILYYLKKMDSWLLANPKREKKNYERFILNWLKREEEKIKAQNIIKTIANNKNV